MAPPPGAHPAGGTSKRSRDDAADTDNAVISTKKVPPYHPEEKEQTPKSATLTKEWHLLAQGRQALYKLLTEPFMASAHSNTLTKKLVALAEECLINRKQEDTIVCVIGNMGGGKSATLNSLFHVGNIARAEDKGKSCTLASNLFSAPKKEQKTPFLAEVFFFSHQERRDLLASYLRDYFRALHHSGEVVEGIADDENLTIRDEVVKAFLALFQDKPECRSKKDVRMFLDTAESEDDPDVLDKLYSWSDSLLHRARSGKKSLTFTASTAGELLTQLESYATEIDTEDGCSECSLWPMVSLIQFHFDDPLTKLGIVFLDTPGLSDHNRTRKLSALKYARHKSHALIVTDAGRAQSDSCVATEVKSMNILGPNRVVIVLPKSDIIGDATMPSGSKRQKEIVRHLHKKCGTLERELEDLEKLIESAEEEDDGDASVRLNMQRRQMEVRVHQAKCAEKAHRIHMRSENNQAELQEKLHDVSDSTTLVPVINVSNLAYSKHVAGFNPKAAPVLGVNETNIPYLRRLISTFTNEARLNEARYEQTITVPRLISRWQIFTSRTPIERKTDMQSHIMSPLKRYGSIIRQVFSQLASRLTEIVSTPTRNEEKDWLIKAQALCTAWEDEFKPATSLSLMNKHGHRRGNKKSRAVNMSDDLVKLSASKIAKLFQAAVQNQISFESTMTEDILELFGDMERSLQEDANSSFVDLGPFFRFLGVEKPRLLSSIRQSANRVLKELEMVRRKATFAEEDAYVVTAMLPIYEKVCVLKNTPKKSMDPNAPYVKMPPGGWPKERNRVFRREVCQPNGVWAAVFTGIEADLEAMLKNESTTLVQDIGAVFDDCLEAYESMCEAKQASSPEEAKLQADVAANLKKAEELLSGTMQTAYNKLRKDFQ